MNEREKSNVKVRRIDFAGIEADATKSLNDNLERYGITVEEGEEVRAHIHNDWGIVETDEGLYVLCTEGVGPDGPVEDEMIFDVGYRTFKDGKPASFSMFPVASTNLTPQELRQMATGETVTLEEFIRQFGSRLESNYRQWNNVLSRIVAAPA
jgi:hypothetical protein